MQNPTDRNADPMATDEHPIAVWVTPKPGTTYGNIKPQRSNVAWLEAHDNAPQVVSPDDNIPF